LKVEIFVALYTNARLSIQKCCTNYMFGVQSENINIMGSYFKVTRLVCSDILIKCDLLWVQSMQVCATLNNFINSSMKMLLCWNKYNRHADIWHWSKAAYHNIFEAKDLGKTICNLHTICTWCLQTFKHTNIL